MLPPDPIYEHEYSLKKLINFDTYVEGVEYMKQQEPAAVRFLIKRSTCKNDERFKNEHQFDTHVAFSPSKPLTTIVFRRKDEENNINYEWKGLIKKCNIFIINWLHKHNDSNQQIYDFVYTECCERLATLDEIVQFSHRLDSSLPESSCHYINQSYVERYYIIYTVNKHNIREAYEIYHNANGTVEYFYTYELEYNTPNKNDPHLCSFTGNVKSIISENKARYYPHYEALINFDERWLLYLEKNITQRPFTVSSKYNDPLYYSYKLDGIKCLAIFLYKKLYILSNNTIMVHGDYNIGIDFCAVLSIECINNNIIIIDILGIIKPIREQKTFLTKSELEYVELTPWITFIKIDHITAIECIRLIKHSDIEYNKFFPFIDTTSIQVAHSNLHKLKQPVDGILIFGDTFIYKLKSYQTIELYIDILELLNVNKIIEKTDKRLQDLNYNTDYSNYIKDGNRNRISSYLHMHYVNLPNVVDVCIDASYKYAKLRPMLEFKVVHVSQKHNVHEIKEGEQPKYKTVTVEYVKIRNDKINADSKNKIINIIDSVYENIIY